VSRFPIRRSVFLFVGVLLTATGVSPASGQTLDDLRDSLRDSVEAARYGSLIIGFVDLSEETVLSGGNFRLDDDPNVDFKTLRIPFATTFGEPGERALYLEGSLGALEAKADFPDIFEGELPALATRAESTWRAFSALGGIGVRFPVGEGTSLTPILDLGLAYIENEVDYSGRGEPLVAAIADGILFEWDATILSYGLGLRLDDRHELGRGIHIETILRYDLRRSEALASTDEAQDVEETSQRGSVRVDLTGATPFSIRDETLRWRTFAGVYHFFGDTGKVIGFQNIYEAGIGLDVVPPWKIPYVTQLEIRASALFGDGIEGYSFGFGVEF
jgi:hypothetical protein